MRKIDYTNPAGTVIASEFRRVLHHSPRPHGRACRAAVNHRFSTVLVERSRRPKKTKQKTGWRDILKLGTRMFSRAPPPSRHLPTFACLRSVFKSELLHCGLANKNRTSPPLCARGARLKRRTFENRDDRALGIKGSLFLKREAAGGRWRHARKSVLLSQHPAR